MQGAAVGAEQRHEEAGPDRQDGDEAGGGADEAVPNGSRCGRSDGAAGTTRVPASILPIVCPPAAVNIVR